MQRIACFSASTDADLLFPVAVSFLVELTPSAGWPSSRCIVSAQMWRTRRVYSSVSSRKRLMSFRLRAGRSLSLKRRPGKVLAARRRRFFLRSCRRPCSRSSFVGQCLFVFGSGWPSAAKNSWTRSSASSWVRPVIGQIRREVANRFDRVCRVPCVQRAIRLALRARCSNEW